MSKKPFTERLGDFIAGKGFYIVLFLCVAAIGISGYYLFSTLGSGAEDTAADAPAQVVVPPSSSPTPSGQAEAVKPTVTPKPAVTPNVTAKPEVTATPSASPTPTVTPTPAATPKPLATPAVSAAVFTWPVKGEIIHDFSLEVLAYDETMGDWRTHCGLDIAADVGIKVCAVSDGTVKAVYEDDLMGTTVVIDHGKGLTSTYSNLAQIPAAEVGGKVETGTVIGSVGETALAESGRPSHLHFEMSRNGTIVDPMQYLP